MITTASMCSPSPGLVRLTRVGQSLEVRPTHAELRRQLRALMHLPAPDAQRGCAIKTVTCPLFREREDGTLSCWAGLEPVVRAILERHGCEVQVEDKPVVGPPPTTPSRLGDLARGGRGLFRFDGGVLPAADVVAWIADRFPDAKVAVVVSRVKDAREVARRLRVSNPEVVTVTRRTATTDAEPPRVVVTTLAGLSHDAVDVERRDLVIVLDAAQALGSHPRYCLSFARRAVLIGLLDRRRQLAPLEWDGLRRLFGFEEICINLGPRVEPAVTVVRLPVRGGTLFPAALDVLELKRRAVWRNAVRNRRVARLARLLQTGDVEQVAQRYPELVDVRAGRRERHVLVLAENVGHGLALARLLPGWPLLVAGEVHLDSRHGDAGVNVRRVVVGEVVAEPHAVITWSAAENCQVPRPDVVIRADVFGGLPPAGLVPGGGASAVDSRESDSAESLFVGAGTGEEILFHKNNLPPSVPGVDAAGGSEILFHKKNSPFSPAALGPGEVLLIDFDDRRHPLLRRWHRRRQRAYIRRGWFAPGVNPIEARVEEFLAARPAGEP